LSARHKRTPGVLVAMATLLIAIPALLPAHAESQNAPTYEVQALSTVPAQDARSTDREAVAALEQRPNQPASRRVEPGDNLWTIARERLGPDAPADLIAVETGQIFEFNRDRIGQDPDRILPGQELLLTEGLPPGPEQTEVDAAPAAPSADSKDEHAADPSQTESSSWTNSDPAYPKPDRAIGARYDAMTLTLLGGLFLGSLGIAVFGASKLLWIRKSLRERVEPPAHERLLIYRYNDGAYDDLRRPKQEADRHDAEAPEPAIAGSQTSNVSVSSPGSENQT
jgi:hypothetical protein